MNVKTKTKNNLCTQHVLDLFSIFMYIRTELEIQYCGLVNAKIRASDKDLPVLSHKNANLLSLII